MFMAVCAEVHLGWKETFPAGNGGGGRLSVISSPQISPNCQVWLNWWSFVFVLLFADGLAEEDSYYGAC